MKNFWILVIAIGVIIVLIGGYMGRHRIQSMLGMSPVQQVMQLKSTSTPPSSAVVPTDNIYKTKTNPVKGVYLTDFQGMTLYTFDKDAAGVSNCYGPCAAIWPFYTSGATAESMLPTNVTVITRKDGSKQFAWKGMPLYYYAKDQKAGDINGDGIGGVWHIGKP